MNAVNLSLLPDNSSISDDGVLSIAGCRVDELARRFGTPLFVHDEEHIRSRAREAVSSFGTDCVIYATKAFLNMAMARLAHEEGLLLDVATGGELFVALSAGVPAHRCVLHGNNKSDEELRYAISEGVRHIVVDSFDEIDRIEDIVSSGSSAQVPRVQIRITPGVHVHTHEFVQTGQDDSKFGFNLRNGDAERAVNRARTSRAMNLVGIHCHIGSNVFAADNFARASDVMVELFNSLDVEELTLGGGLGVAYTNEESAPTITEWAHVLEPARSKLREGAVVMVEPGRSVVASSAITVYTVGTVKPIEGIRTYISVDGGMSDNPRPVLYGSGYEVFDPCRANAPRPAHARIVGKHCESGDVLVNDAPVPEHIAVGDLLATPVTGAYGYSMANNYNKVPRPAVVFVRDGNARVVVRRETYEDLIRLDQ